MNLDWLFGPSQQTTTTQTAASAPDWYMNAMKGNTQRSIDVTNRGYVPYPHQRTAGFTQDQLSAFDSVRKGQGAEAPMYDAAGNMINAGANTSAAGAAQPFVQTAMGTSASGAAQPFMAKAGQTFPANFQTYMNPFTQGVTDRIADLGVENFREKILPALDDTFIANGTFGGGKQKEFLGRATRDLSREILGRQSEALERGFGTAANIFSADQSRLAGLAGTAGQLAGTDANKALEAGRLTGGLTAEDADRKLNAGKATADLAGAKQAARYKDVGALEAVGRSQQELEQKNLDTLRSDFVEQRDWDKNNAAWLQAQLAGTNVPRSSTQTTTAPTNNGSPLNQAIGAGISISELLKKLGDFKFAEGGMVRAYAGGGEVDADEEDETETSSSSGSAFSPALIEMLTSDDPNLLRRIREAEGRMTRSIDKPMAKSSYDTPLMRLGLGLMTSKERGLLPALGGAAASTIDSMNKEETLNSDREKQLAELEYKLATGARDADLKRKTLLSKLMKSPGQGTEYERHIKTLAEMDARGVPPTDPERQRIQKRVDYLTTKGNGVEVRVDTGLSKPMEAAQAKIYERAQEGADQAYRLTQQFDLIEQAVNDLEGSFYEPGSFGQLRTQLGRAGLTLGADVDPKKLAAGELMNSLATQMAVLQRVPGSGATTDFEMKLYLQAVPGLDLTVAGNRQLLNMGRKLAARNMEIAEMMEDYIVTNGKIDRGFREKVKALGPVFSPEEIQILESKAAEKSKPKVRELGGP